MASLAVPTAAERPRACPEAGTLVATSPIIWAGRHANGVDGFAKAGPHPTDFAPNRHPVPDAGLGQQSANNTASGALGGSHGGDGGSLLAKHAPGGSVPNNGSIPAAGGATNGALGGEHGGPTLAKAPIGDPSIATSSLGGGQLGGAHGAGPLHGPHLGAAPGSDALAAHASVDASPVAPPSRGASIGGLGSGWSTERDWAPPDWPPAPSRAGSMTWAGLPSCRNCGREPQSHARFCGYCGEALDQTLY